MVQPDIAIEPIFMYFSTFHWHTLVNGYSGFSPPSYPPLVDLMADFPNDAAIAELRRRGVTHVVVHGAFYRPEEYKRLVERLDQSTDLDAVGTVQWQHRPTRMYRLLPSSTSQ